MTRKQYLKQLDKLSKWYRVLRKEFSQSNGAMQKALQQEENEKKLQLTIQFYKQLGKE